MSVKIKLWTLLASLTATVFLGALADRWLFNNGQVGDPGETFSEIHANTKYDFINPLLECEIGGRSLTKDILPFSKKLTNYIQSSKDQSLLSFASVYFRDLNNGIWLGVNEKEEFSPASLLKVPVMIAALKTSELKPGFLNKTAVYNGPDENAGEIIQPTEALRIGHPYTLDETVRRMIVYSDNDAKNLILENLDPKIIASTFYNLGIENPFASTTGYGIQVKDYASFFRILYNASYLSYDNSEKALALLSQTDFKYGLVAGIPDSVRVAHKFGVRTFKDAQQQQQQQQLHDCGIIYYPGHPYVLCVMTRGNDINQLAQSIAEISGLVYREVVRQSR